jgi:TrpR-related protein YerC/YecD
MTNGKHCTDAELERLYRAVCSLEDAAEASAFLADILSPKEMDELAQRLEVARMLSGGSSYLDVSAATGASSTTVSRVSKCLNGVVGGYRLVLGRIGETGE